MLFLTALQENYLKKGIFHKTLGETHWATGSNLKSQQTVIDLFLDFTLCFYILFTSIYAASNLSQGNWDFSNVSIKDSNTETSRETGALYRKLKSLNLFWGLSKLFCQLHFEKEKKKWNFILIELQTSDKSYLLVC